MAKMILKDLIIHTEYQVPDLEKVTVGRDKGNSIVVSTSKSISRKHCIIYPKEGVIVDRNSSNGTYVNGTMLLPKQEVELNNGDRISLSNTYHLEVIIKNDGEIEGENGKR